MSGLIYSFVARERTVLAEHTSGALGNYRTVAIECLQNSHITDDKFTVTADAYTFNYLVQGGYSELGLPAVAVAKSPSAWWLAIPTADLGCLIPLPCSLPGGGG